MSLVIKNPLRYNNRHNLRSNTGPRGYLLGRLTDPVKRRAYQLVPSWSGWTGLWDCSFEDSGIHQRFDHFKKRFPLSVINPTCLQLCLYVVRRLCPLASDKKYKKKWTRDCWGGGNKNKRPTERNTRTNNFDIDICLLTSLIGYSFVGRINCKTLS